MSELLLAVLTPVAAAAVAMAVYPIVLRFAVRHSILDNPNARKLQRVPVPVMGGVAVFFGLVAALFFDEIFIDFDIRRAGVLSFTAMLAVGLWDDVKDVPATLKFIIEVFVVWAIASFSKTGVVDLHGLWGVHSISLYLSLPLSIIAGVGIINAINLIDGVDGYSSGFCIFACGCFATFFFYAGACNMGLLALACAGALVPFFLHNVFGSKSKMFIGDSGTLMLGTIMTIFVFTALSDGGHPLPAADGSFGRVPFVLAVLAIPVFDTLRVMSMRIIRGTSPFHPDKTHLHHLFIEAGFSHVGTAFYIVMMNLAIVLLWFVSWKLGASIDLQFYIVVALGLLFTFAFYRYMRIQQAGGWKAVRRRGKDSAASDDDENIEGSAVWKAMCRLGGYSHMERKSFWLLLRRLMDGR